MTRRLFPFLPLLALALTHCAQPPQNTQSAPPDAHDVYVVAHIDVTPNHAADTAKLLQQYRSDSVKEDGSVRLEVMVQDGRSNHFTVVEVWSTRAAFEAHTAQQHTKDFRETLQPYLGSPYDERLHALL